MATGPLIGIEWSASGCQGCRDSRESRQSDSNRRPADYKSAALPAELCRRFTSTNNPVGPIPKISQVYNTISAVLLKQISPTVCGVEEIHGRRGGPMNGALTGA